LGNFSPGSLRRSQTQNITVGNTRIAEPSRCWAIKLDDETLLFADTADLQSLHNKA